MRVCAFFLLLSVDSLDFPCPSLQSLNRNTSTYPNGLECVCVVVLLPSPSTSRFPSIPSHACGIGLRNQSGVKRSLLFFSQALLTHCSLSLSLNSLDPHTRAGVALRGHGLGCWNVCVCVCSPSSSALISHISPTYPDGLCMSPTFHLMIPFEISYRRDWFAKSGRLSELIERLGRGLGWWM
jgi:hypothetical protein